MKIYFALAYQTNTFHRNTGDLSKLCMPQDTVIQTGYIIMQNQILIWNYLVIKCVTYVT